METDRLSYKDLSIHHTTFIYELLNTDEWKLFIGNRNILTTEDAEIYIKKILNNEAVKYYVVHLKDQFNAIGIITLIKREYLEHFDIGFAFLPRYARKGYAYEAAAFILQMEIKSGRHSEILATTVPENNKSIRLLEKLGLKWQKEIVVEGEKLLLYSLLLNPADTNNLSFN